MGVRVGFQIYKISEIRFFNKIRVGDRGQLSCPEELPSTPGQLEVVQEHDLVYNIKSARSLPVFTVNF